MLCGAFSEGSGAQLVALHGPQILIVSIALAIAIADADAILGS